MSGYQNNGPKIPELGTGILRPPKNPKEKSPAFTGLVNYNGQIMSVSIWYMAPNGQMPASFSVKTQTYDPNRGAAPQGQGYPPQQQAMQYGAQQHAPQPQQYAPQHQQAPQQYPPQQATGYQPAPSYAPQPAPQQAPQGYPPQGGYVPTPSAAPQQAPANGGYTQGYGQPAATFQRDEIPF